MSRSLAALDCSITSHMTLGNDWRSPLILDSQLNRFTLLRHLSLGDGITPHKSFFTAILATPLISLCLGRDFDLDAQNMIDALKDPGSAKQLEELALDNVDLDGDDDLGEREVPDCWTDNCTLEHIAELRTIAETGGFELNGATLEAAEYCEEIIEQLDEDEEGFRYEDEYLER